MGRQQKFLRKKLIDNLEEQIILKEQKRENSRRT